MNLEINIIVAHSENRVIGRDGTMPWHLPRDLAHFKAHTTGFPIIMGHNTFCSIGKALPNRHNIVLSRQENLHLNGVDVCQNLETALKCAGAVEKVFIIGGGQFYQQTLPLADRILMTIVHTTVVGDTFFPVLAKEKWQETQTEFFPKDDNNAFDLTFSTFVRKS